MALNSACRHSVERIPLAERESAFASSSRIVMQVVDINLVDLLRVNRLLTCWLKLRCGTMLRKWKFGSVCLFLLASAFSAEDVLAWGGYVNTPYASFCNVGHCGGGNYFIPRWRCRNCSRPTYNAAAPQAGSYQTSAKRLVRTPNIVPAGANSGSMTAPTQANHVTPANETTPK